MRNRNKKTQSNRIFLKTMMLITCFMLVIIYNKSKAADTKPVIGSSVALTFKQNAQKNVLNVSVKATSPAMAELYLFTIDGKLVKQVLLSTDQVTKIKNLKKGTYMYECFQKDIHVKSGSINIK